MGTWAGVKREEETAARESKRGTGRAGKGLEVHRLAAPSPWASSRGGRGTPCRGFPSDDNLRLQRDSRGGSAEGLLMSKLRQLRFQRPQARAAATFP